MPEDLNPRAMIGDNNPPPYRESVVEQHNAKAVEFLDAAGDWLDLKEIQSAEQAAELNDFIAGVKARIKETDADRKSDKAPFDEAGKAVQAAYAPIIDKLKKAVERVAPMQTAWLRKLDAQRKAEAEAKAEAARKAQEEAARQAAQAASRNDLAGEAEAAAAAKRAEEMQKEAERAAKARAQAGSASGGARTASLRRFVHARLVNERAAFMHFQGHPDLVECLTRLANAEVRAKGFDPKTDKIPGFEIFTEEKAV